MAFGSEAGVAGAQGEEPYRVAGFAGAGSRSMARTRGSGVAQREEQRTEFGRKAGHWSGERPCERREERGHR